MSERSCHRLQSTSGVKLKGNESLNEAASVELGASKRWEGIPKMLLNFEQRLQAASYKLQVEANKFFQYMRNFKGLLIWQKGMEIVKLVYKVAKYLPKEERYGLQLQMTKSAISIPSNIAEGSAKRSQKDYLRYVEISLGSAYELETQSLVVQAQNWAPVGLINNLIDQIEQEQRMISKFIDKL